jgi:2-oxoglutarate ferredoxin oxidoreductase subunit gamma
MEKQLFIGGFGGQGAALIGKMIGYAAAVENKDSAFFPEYETAMRGGASNCTVIVSDQKIQSVVLEQFDYVVAMDKRTLNEHLNRVKTGGTLLVNTSLVKEPIDREDIRIVEVPMNDMADELGNDKTANIIMLGAIAAITGMVEKESLIKKIASQFAGKEKVIALNIQAFEKGYALVS